MRPYGMKIDGQRRDMRDGKPKRSKHSGNKLLARRIKKVERRLGIKLIRASELMNREAV